MSDISRKSLEMELYARARECDAFIEKARVDAEFWLAAAKAALRNAIQHSDLTQPGLVSPERWEARTVVCATNCVSYHLSIPGGGWSLSGDPCARLSAAEEVCNQAAKKLAFLPQETRYVRNEAEVLRRLASDVRMHRIGQAMFSEDSD